MSQGTLFLILLIIFTIVGVTFALKYKGHVSIPGMVIATLLVPSSISLIFSAGFAVTWSKDYLNEVGAIIDNKEITDISIDDGLFKDKLSITYKDSDNNEIVYDTELPWYLDVTTATSDELWIDIDSNNGEFTVHVPADYKSDNKHSYASKKSTP